MQKTIFGNIIIIIKKQKLFYRREIRRQRNNKKDERRKEKKEREKTRRGKITQREKKWLMATRLMMIYTYTWRREQEKSKKRLPVSKFQRTAQEQGGRSGSVF